MTMRCSLALGKISFFITACAKITTEQYEEVSALTSICKTITSDLFKWNQTLCYITVAPKLEPHLTDCLITLNSTLVSANSKEFLTYVSCDGYLIVSDNFTYLETLFDYPRSKFEFAVFKNVLILYSGAQNFLTRPFSDVAFLKGNNIIVADNFRIDSSVENIRISSVLQNKTITWIYYYDHNNVGIINTPPSWKPNFRNNQTFKVATFLCVPFIYINDANEVYDGINFHLSNLLMRDWPITYTVYKNVPYMNIYNVVFKSVHYGLDDTVACPIWLKESLSMGLEHTHSYSETCSTFLVPKPHELTPTWFVYQSFDPLTWISIGISTIIVGYLINITYKAFGRTGDFPYCLLQSLRILSIGPIAYIPKEAHFILKPLLLIWFVVSLILATGYSTGFSSILTYPILWDIKTMEDMVKGGIKWGEQVDFFKNDLIASIQPGAKELSENFLLEENVDVRNERIRSGKYAMITHRVLDDYITATENLDEYSRKALKVLSQCYMTNSVVYVLTPNSPYKDFLNQRILQILQHGFVHYWTNSVILKNNMLYTYRFFDKYGERSAPVPLNVAKIQGIFYFLIIGYILSVTAFIIEICCNYFALKRQKSDENQTHIYRNQLSKIHY